MPQDKSIKSLIYHLEKAIEALKQTEDVRAAQLHIWFASSLSNLMMIKIERDNA